MSSMLFQAWSGLFYKIIKSVANLTAVRYVVIAILNDNNV